MREVLLKTYAALPAVRQNEVFRYAGGKGDADEKVRALIEECVALALPVLSYKVCFLTLSVSEFFKTFGECSLTKTRLDGCERALIFGASLGLGIDRLIARYAGTQTAKALLLQALGAERIERLCDEFCQDIARDYAAQGFSVGGRFSAGYGDFPLEKQTEFFALLDCGRKIGLTLNESLLMSPSKSVTAAVGMRKNRE